MLEVQGWCPVCEHATTFKADDAWLRDHFICRRCECVPRERALAVVLDQVRPQWRTDRIHESSPSPRGSAKIIRQCRDYTPSQHDPSTPNGQLSRDRSYRSEDLEAQTFPDVCFDVVITQDVFEHLFDPGRAVAEICRTLRPGGLHICTVPLIQREQPSQRRARRTETGEIIHLSPPQYHGNPIDPEGSLVTIDWGFDIADYFDQHAEFSTTIFQIDDLSRGIRAELNEVLVSRKTVSGGPSDI